jgi:hypothetical protein
LKGITFSKKIPIECRKYPTPKLKEFRVLTLSTDLSRFSPCREKPSKKASRKTTQRERALISKGYITHKEMAYHLLPARVQ